MKKLTLSETRASAGKPPKLAGECWFDDACILDMDYFVKTIAGIRAKGVRPDLIGSIITHYASKWLPELAENDAAIKYPAAATESAVTETVTASWMKKRFFVETLVGILPPEKDSVPCNFLLRLLRTANMVGAEATQRAELEKRIAWQLEQASLKEVMIPSFSHSSVTLLDVGLVIRLVKKFVSNNLDGVDGGGGGSHRGGGAAALMKVAKLVDGYLAEAALDGGLSLEEFVALAAAVPSHARAMDDALYRAIDTYLKAHPDVSKAERKGLCRLIDSRKLTPEASIHASQNERLPVRAIMQVLFSEQTILNRYHLDWSGSLSSSRSPIPGAGLEPCLSKRHVNAQQVEIRNLKEEVLRLQSQCQTMQAQLEKVVEKKRGSNNIFRWRKLGFMSTFKSGGMSVFEKIEEGHEGDAVEGGRIQTPIEMKTRLVRGRNTPHKWRKSMS